MTQSGVDLLNAQRARWVAILAKAPRQDLIALAAEWGAPPAYERLRGPELGFVMLRGRTGGTGAPFNLGEMTVTRCSVRLGDGTLGHAYIRGRDAEHCETAAWLDAVLQNPLHRDELLEKVVEPLAQDAAARKELAARKVAATRVDFFTLAAGRP